MLKYLVIVIYIICTTLGITFMKLGGDSLHLSLQNKLSFQVGYTTFLGLCSYVISFFLWQKLVVKYDVSLIVPVVNGIVQVIVLLVGHFVFKENLSMMSLIGSLLVILGIILIGFGNK